MKELHFIQKGHCMDMAELINNTNFRSDLYDGPTALLSS